MVLNPKKKKKKSYIIGRFTNIFKDIRQSVTKLRAGPVNPMFH